MCKEYSYKGLLDVIGGESGVYSLEKKAGFSVADNLDTDKLGILCKILKCKVGDLVNYVREEDAVSLDSLQLKSKNELKKLLIERIREQYRSGEKTVAELSRETGIEDNTIYRYVKDVEVLVNKREIRDNQILELRKAGKTVREISDITGVPLQTVYKTLERNGVKNNPKSVDEDIKRQALADYKSKRFTVSQIAKKYNISEAAVYKWARLENKGLEEPKERKPKKSKFSDSAIQEIIKEYQAGSGIRCLSKKNKTSPMTIKRLLEEANVYEGVREISKDNKNKDEVITLIKEGYSVKETCDKLNVSSCFVYTILKDANIKPKTKVPECFQALLDDWLKETEIAASIAQYNAILDQLAVKYGICKRTAVSRLKSFGVTFPRMSVQEKKDQIVKLFKEGVTPIEIGSRLDCSRTYVYKVLEENGIERNRKQKEKILPVEEIIIAYKDGLNLNKLARKFNISNLAVREVLVNNGVEIRSNARGFVSEDIPEKVLQLSKDCMPKEIADKLGISLSSVYKIFRENKEISENK